jgi:hypothetical protein
MKNLVLNSKSLILFVYFILFSCSSVQYISNYDEVTNKNFVLLHEKVATLFVEIEDQIGTNASKYSNFEQSYKKIKVNLKVLKIRTAAIEKNEIIQNQVAELIKMIDNLQQLHKIGFSSIEQIKALEQPFNAAFIAIAKLQNGVKNKVGTKITQ